MLGPAWTSDRAVRIEERVVVIPDTWELFIAKRIAEVHAGEVIVAEERHRYGSSGLGAERVEVRLMNEGGRGVSGCRTILSANNFDIL